VRAILKYGAKKDANHKEIMTAMKEHCPVWDMSHLGCGVPDGLAWVQNNTWQLFDIKNPKTTYGRKGLNERQKEWLGQWHHRGPVFLIRTVEEAVKLAKADFVDLDFEIASSEGINLD
jgi:hypothetical protein